ncbi:hypothetical protein CDL15_Pgr020690 [Punica granatum]|uniref:Uncharacterized protein n=1 Tax=Punica granatum TaxID=22663 RepID=A0A218WRC0_PUNGR|nr:hypothetical protein CDL15_Pgr020690 [Punica granatum]
MTTGTFLGKSSRVPKGHLELVPRPWWSLGACRPALRGRLLVSGANPGSSVRKGVRGGSGVSALAGCPENASGHHVGHFGTEGDF